MLRKFIALLSVVIGSSSYLRAEHYAFLVGVRQYEPTELTSLEYTEKDVTDLAAALKSVGYLDDNIVLMTQTEGATRARFLPIVKNIQNELVLLCRELGPEDTLLVAFSGHGVQFKGETDMYFCPADAKLSTRATLVSLTKVYEILANKEICKASNKILIVDACRNNPQSNVSKAAKEIELEPAGVAQRPAPPGGIAAFFSCSQGQKSFEHPDLQHGVFANYVIEAFTGKGDLDNDGELSLAEFEQHCVKSTQKYARRVLGEAQTPERRGETRGLVTLASFPNRSTGPAAKIVSKATGMELLLIPSGSFDMGSHESKANLEAAGLVVPFDVSDESPQHKVTISRPFYLGQHEVTVGQFRKFVAATGYKTEAEKDGRGGWGYNATTQFPEQKPEFNWKSTGFPQTDDHPVINITWNDAMAFCQWAGKLDGREYRLPTEAEWEYACRAGTRTRFATGDTGSTLKNYANVRDSSFEKKFPKTDFEKFPSLPFDDGYGFTAPVGSYRPNEFGLYDMHGNVWEWGSDWYDAKYYTNTSKVDPSGPSMGSNRVVRGGGWNNLVAARLRSANRNWFPPFNRDFSLGFRVASSSVH